MAVFLVSIKSLASDRIVQDLGERPSERTAEGLADSMMSQINLEEFYIDIEEVNND